MGVSDGPKQVSVSVRSQVWFTMLSQNFKRGRIDEKVVPLVFQGVALHESGSPATHCFCLLSKKVPIVQLNLIVIPPSTHMKNNVQDRG